MWAKKSVNILAIGLWTWTKPKLYGKIKLSPAETIRTFVPYWQFQQEEKPQTNQFIKYDSHPCEHEDVGHDAIWFPWNDILSKSIAFRILDLFEFFLGMIKKSDWKRHNWQVNNDAARFFLCLVFLPMKDFSLPLAWLEEKPFYVASMLQHGEGRRQAQQRDGGKASLSAYGSSRERPVG